MAVGVALAAVPLPLEIAPKTKSVAITTAAISTRTPTSRASLPAVLVGAANPACAEPEVAGPLAADVDRGRPEEPRAAALDRFFELILGFLLGAGDRPRSARRPRA